MQRSLEFVGIIVSAALIAISFNFFLIPHQLITGGLSGIAMITGYFTGWNIGLFYFISNLPLIIWGLLAVGRRFIVLSVFSVLFTSWFMQIIPVNTAMASFDTTIAAVFGGVLLGLGSGISLRVGGSSGGFDIVGLILTRGRDFPLGATLFMFNGLVIIALGYFKQDWNLALYSMLSIFITGRVMDTIHTQHMKLTAFIITEHKELLKEKLLQLPRGVTLLKTEGAYSNQEKDMLMTVISHYELAELKDIIKKCDPKAFVNIVQTTAVIGEFHKRK